MSSERITTLQKLFPLPVFIGLRYLRSKKSNRSISFFSLVSLLGLSLGVAAIVIVLSVMNGFENEMHSRILGMLPHLSVENKNLTNTQGNRIDSDNWAMMAEGVLQDRDKMQKATRSYVEAAAPFVEMDGLIHKEAAVKGLRVVGVLPEHESKVSIVDEYILAGSFHSLAKPEQNIVLGSDIARSLGIVVGDNITLVFPKVENKRLLSQYYDFTVSGFFDVGAEADALLAYVNLQDASQLKYQSKQIDGIRFQLQDLEQVDAVETYLEPFFTPQYQLDSWKSKHGQLFQTVKLEKVMTGAMLMLIVLVAAFNTISSLSMMVTEKHTSIAVLRTMGFKRHEVVAIFFVQGFIVSGFGVLAGLAVGVLVAVYLEPLIYFINSLEILWFAPLKSELRIMDVVWVSILAFCISVLASIIPARRAAKIEPADAVRYH